MKLYFAILAVLFTLNSLAQVQLPIPREIQKTYKKNTRSTTGMPGKNYWQNRASYTIDVAFNPTTRLVSGTCKVLYSNNSPDTLKKVAWKLYPNLYQKGAPRATTIKPEDLHDGVNIKNFRIGNDSISAKNIRIAATNMTTNVPAILPGGKANFSVDFSYTLNKGSHMRTGEVEDGAYFIAYFFPRIAVYDDIDGWNQYAYLGSYEFYNDFCDFDVRYTLPADYLVWSTGELQNTSEIFTPTFAARINAAEREDAIRFIVDSTDLVNGGITKNDSTHTWHYTAKNVTDFVFAASNHYLWQGSSVEVDKVTHRRTRVDAVFNKKHKDYFLVASDARKTVEAMSFEFPKWPFPYSHETVFDGLDQMEYPMMVNDNPVEDRAESIELTDHEIFHTMFPFYMGINETKYAWMDEGWATIGEWLISPMIDSSLVDEYGVQPYASAAGTELDLPVNTLTTQINGTTGFINSYPKPAMGYLYVKDMLGDKLFYKALHNYIAAWNGKHPMPYDFFNSMNAGAGKNMNWFWKRWFFDDGVPDMALTVTGKGTYKYLTVTNKGSKPLPVYLQVIYKDGSIENIHKTISVWEKGDTSIRIPLKFAKQIQQITMQHPHVPDANPADNTWTAP